VVKRLGEFGQHKLAEVGDFGDDDAGTVTPVEIPLSRLLCGRVYSHRQRLE